MKTRNHQRRCRVARAIAMTAVILIMAPRAFAHCDGMDGPVVKAAEKALAEGNVNRVLIWVQPSDEKEIRAAFEHVLVVRKLGDEARALADRFFFETLVRVHRAGEGAAYTGLKPAGGELPEVIVLADEAVESGKIEAVVEELNRQSSKVVEEKFKAVQRAKGFKPDDVAAGREFVRAYFEYVHTVEGIHVASSNVSRHEIEGGESAKHTELHSHTE